MSSTPQLIHSIAQLRARLAEHDGPVALVPTMGALHRGHLSLVDRAAAQPDALVIVSIFVNPLQFGAGEDLDAYPRTLDADMAALSGTGADIVFAPSPAEMYPQGPRTLIHPGPLGTVLEGAARPTHFAGVLTVVAKLFAITGATDAYFGEKDYQQLVLIRQLVADLNLPVRIHGCPIVREEDGVALSSRNRYLSAEQRTLARTLSAALAAGCAAGHTRAEEAAQEVCARHPEVVVDYITLTDPTLGPAPASGPARLLIAARVGTTRLLDNAALADS
ncbi:Pantothenate synthetase [Corynebacterium ciconiae DSM 44920]|uniref:pantoate--beta-alanine ligase n=1 Tax=Corynebacterium ciconiae TaxID=227319 RepID=UPI00037A89DB|nr:pantoate--beta-alanine ligase [Corynebacterium ciconiae]WKD61895.1 Pantothenate synthetase [Corynebacterium ciconiae DSM 44920]